MTKPDTIESIKDVNIYFITKTGKDAKSPNEAWRAMRAIIEANAWKGTGLRYFGIWQNNPFTTKEADLCYDAAIVTSQNTERKTDLEEKVLKGGKYAMFTHKGKYANLEKTFSQILTKWLPKSNETFDETRNSFCEYIEMEKASANPQELITKIYIPIL